MNRLKLTIGIGVLFSALLAITISASAAEFKAKEKCPNKDVGCFGGAKNLSEQKFEFETELEKIPFKIVCTEIGLAENNVYEVPQKENPMIQVNGPQKTGKRRRREGNRIETRRKSPLWSYKTRIQWVQI
jgi:hypothetical protein